MSTIKVSIVSATVGEASVHHVTLELPATVATALTTAGIKHGGDDLGVWGKRAAIDTPLNDGDRIELYRPLIADPKQARHKRASEQGYRWQGRTRRAARSQTSDDNAVMPDGDAKP